MSGQMLVIRRRQPLLAVDMTSSNSVNFRSGVGNDRNEGGRSRRRSRIGETAGECAAVCCCPCVVMNIVILALYSIPTGLCKKAWRRRKRWILLERINKNSLEKTGNQWKLNSCRLCMEDHRVDGTMEDCGNDVVDWDDEMWNRFYGAGFWRSDSRRADQ